MMQLSNKFYYYTFKSTKKNWINLDARCKEIKKIILDYDFKAEISTYIIYKDVLEL